MAKKKALFAPQSPRAISRVRRAGSVTALDSMHYRAAGNKGAQGKTSKTSKVSSPLRLVRTLKTIFQLTTREPKLFRKRCRRKETRSV